MTVWPYDPYDPYDSAGWRSSDAGQACGALGIEASALGKLVSWKAGGFNVHLMDIKTRDPYDSAGCAKSNILCL